MTSEKSDLIIKAVETLGIHDRITYDEIRDRYRTLAKRYHPDVCSDETIDCEAKMREITEAYQLLKTYCEQYRFSFHPEELDAQLTGMEWWISKFASKA